MKNFFSIDNDGKPQFKTVAVASGNDAVITLAADPDEFHVIDWLSWSYGSGLVAADGLLTVEIGGVVVWQINITEAGPGHFEFSKPLYGEKGQAVVITLADGTASGKLNIRHR